MTSAATISIDDICARGIVRDSDVKTLRRMVYEKSGLAAADIEALLRLNRGTRMQDPAWAPFFVEATTDFLVNELPPQGYVTSENATWLMTRIGPAGRVDNAAELEVLLAVLDRARWVPESLVAFALSQVKQAVIGADGPLRAGSRAAAGEITAGEVALIRRVLYAFGGDGNAAQGREDQGLAQNVILSVIFGTAVLHCSMAVTGQKCGDSVAALHGAPVKGGIQALLTAILPQAHAVLDSAAHLPFATGPMGAFKEI